MEFALPTKVTLGDMLPMYMSPCGFVLRLYSLSRSFGLPRLRTHRYWLPADDLERSFTLHVEYRTRTSESYQELIGSEICQMDAQMRTQNISTCCLGYQPLGSVDFWKAVTLRHRTTLYSNTLRQQFDARHLDEPSSKGGQKILGQPQKVCRGGQAECK